MVCPELTEQIRREVAASLHQRKGDFTCYFLTDLVTFTLPAGQSAFYPPYLVFFPPLMAALFLYNEPGDSSKVCLCSCMRTIKILSLEVKAKACV